MKSHQRESSWTLPPLPELPKEAAGAPTLSSATSSVSGVDDRLLQQMQQRALERQRARAQQQSARHAQEHQQHQQTTPIKNETESKVRVELNHYQPPYYLQQHPQDHSASGSIVTPPQTSTSQYHQQLPLQSTSFTTPPTTSSSSISVAPYPMFSIHSLPSSSTTQTAQTTPTDSTVPIMVTPIHASAASHIDLQQKPPTSEPSPSNDVIVRQPTPIRPSNLNNSLSSPYMVVVPTVSSEITTSQHHQSGSKLRRKDVIDAEPLPTHPTFVSRVPEPLPMVDEKKPQSKAAAPITEEPEPEPLPLVGDQKQMKQSGETDSIIAEASMPTIESDVKKSLKESSKNRTISGTLNAERQLHPTSEQTDNTQAQEERVMESTIGHGVDTESKESLTTPSKNPISATTGTPKTRTRRSLPVPSRQLRVATPASPIVTTNSGLQLSRPLQRDEILSRLSSPTVTRDGHRQEYRLASDQIPQTVKREQTPSQVYHTPTLTSAPLHREHDDIDSDTTADFLLAQQLQQQQLEKQQKYIQLLEQQIHQHHIHQQQQLQLHQHYFSPVQPPLNDPLSHPPPRHPQQLQTPNIQPQQLLGSHSRHTSPAPHPSQQRRQHQSPLPPPSFETQEQEEQPTLAQPSDLDSTPEPPNYEQLLQDQLRDHFGSHYDPTLDHLPVHSQSQLDDMLSLFTACRPLFTGCWCYTSTDPLYQKVVRWKYGGLTKDFLFSFPQMPITDSNAGSASTSAKKSSSTDTRSIVVRHLPLRCLMFRDPGSSAASSIHLPCARPSHVCYSTSRILKTDRSLCQEIQADPEFERATRKYLREVDRIATKYAASISSHSEKESTSTAISASSSVTNTPTGRQKIRMKQRPINPATTKASNDHETTSKHDQFYD